MPGKQKRNANIELLRLYAIFTIMVLHYQSSAGMLLTANTPGTALQYIGQFLESFCIPTLATFVLITGYYNRDTQLKPRRILTVLGQTWFYSIGVHVILRLFHVIPPAASVWDLAMYIFPVMSVHYWYVTAFVVMELFAPVLNVAAAHMERRQLRAVILGLLLYISVIKSIIPIHLTADGEGYEFGFFLLLYLIALYMREFTDGSDGRAAMGESSKGSAVGEDNKAAELYDRICGIKTVKNGFVIYTLCCVVIYAVTILAHAVNLRTGSFSYFISVPVHLNYIFTLTASVALFRAFLHLQVREGRPADIIRSLSPFTFGVYLLHCHIDIIYRWVGWLAAPIGGLPQNVPAAVLWMLVSIVIMFAIGVVIELLRRKILAFLCRFC